MFKNFRDNIKDIGIKNITIFSAFWGYVCLVIWNFSFHLLAIILIFLFLIYWFYGFVVGILENEENDYDGFIVFLSNLSMKQMNIIVFSVCVITFVSFYMGITFINHPLNVSPVVFRKAGALIFYEATKFPLFLYWIITLSEWSHITLCFFILIIVGYFVDNKLIDNNYQYTIYPVSTDRKITEWAIFSFFLLS